MPSNMSESILIVDDDPDMCWAMEHALRLQGYEVATASSGRAAYRWLAEHDFRIVLIDAKLPDIEGLEVLAHARAMAWGPVRAILVSGYHYHDDSTVRQALSDGLICGFLAKPFGYRDLLKYIDEVSPQ